MGSSGDAYDNALCESFFATLDCSIVSAFRRRPRPESRSSTSSKVGTTLDYLSPIADEKHERLSMKAASLVPIPETGEITGLRGSAVQPRACSVQRFCQEVC
jgi:hypothetical protein